MLVEHELASAGRGQAGQCGLGRGVEACPWLPSLGRRLVAKQPGASPCSASWAEPALGCDLSSVRKQGIKPGWLWPWDI